MNPLLVLAIQETPAIIDEFKQLFMKNNPDIPAPTSEEVIAAFDTAFQSSLAKDELWKSVHGAA